MRDSSTPRPARNKAPAPVRAHDADDVLLATFHGGDDDAFRALFYRHRDGLVSLTHGLCGDFPIGEELVRRAMVKVFKRRRLPASVTLRLALVRAVVRQARGFERRKSWYALFGLRPRVTIRRILPVHRLPSEARGCRSEHYRRAVYALSRMKWKYRAAVALCDFQRLSYEEAAVVLGCSTRAVGIRLGRGRLQFAVRLQRLLARSSS